MPILPRQSVDSTVKQNLAASQSTTQDRSHPHFTREPLVSEIPNQGFVLATVSGTLYKYTRIGQNRYRTAFIAV